MTEQKDFSLTGRYALTAWNSGVRDVYDKRQIKGCVCCLEEFVEYMCFSIKLVAPLETGPRTISEN